MRPLKSIEISKVSGSQDLLSDFMDGAGAGAGFGFITGLFCSGCLYSTQEALKHFMLAMTTTLIGGLIGGTLAIICEG